MIAGVMVAPGFGTISQDGSRSRREKGKAMLLVCPRGMIRRRSVCLQVDAFVLQGESGTVIVVEN